MRKLQTLSIAQHGNTYLPHEMEKDICNAINHLRNIEFRSNDIGMSQKSIEYSLQDKW